MYPEIVITDRIRIPVYTTLFIVALFLSVAIASKISKLYRIEKEDVAFSAVYGTIGIAVGAKVFYVLTVIPKICLNFSTYISMFKLSPLDTLAYTFGGLVFYGGLIGGVVGLYIYCKKFSIDIDKLIKLDVPFFPLIHGFGRIGCLFAGCCYGIEYYGPLAITYPYNEYDQNLNAFTRFPVQPLEAVLDFILVIILFKISKKSGMTGQKLLSIYIMSYAVIRFFDEYLRGDSARGVYKLFSTSQIISIVLFIIAILSLKDKIPVIDRLKKACIALSVQEEE